MNDVTLETCDREPIQLPGAIQPHGVLFACDAETLSIAYVSDNVGDFFDILPEQALGARFDSLFDDTTSAILRGLDGVDALRELNPVRALARNGACFDLVLHRTGGDRDYLIAELEPSAATAPGTPLDFRLRTSVVRLQAARDIQTLVKVAATQVRAITGFDRVMVYRFDAEWNGEVVAEDRRQDLVPFLGQHYPASDIPAQARRLYTLSPLRFIVDVAYRPSKIVPDAHAESAAPLDLSHAMLRSVSPIHLEYLKNMGVQASMSISLIIDNKLAGLIACHHYTEPRLVAFRIRDTCEHLAHALAWQLRVLEASDRALLVQQAQAHESALVRSLAMCTDMLDGITVPSLLRLTNAKGAAVVLEDGMRTIGVTPTEEQIRGIARWLSRQDHTVVATERLAELQPGAEVFDDCAAGLIAVPVSRELAEYILWFRPSKERTIDWAGDPSKVSVTPSEGAAPRLSPRGSFELWREVVRGRSDPWLPHEVEAASNLRAVLLSGVRNRLVKERALNQSLADADRAKDNFIATVSHELRTPLNAIAGWAQLLLNGEVPVEKQMHAIEVIARNAQAQTDIVDDLLDISRITQGTLSLSVETVDLVALVDAVIEATALATLAKGIRLKRVVDPSASPVQGDPARLRQVLTNLMANAVKFTDKGGSIQLVLRRVGSDVELSVTDSGRGIDAAFLPRVFDPFQQEDAGASRRVGGIGLGLAIARKLTELHGGSIEAASQGLGHGATFTVRLPVSPLLRETTHVPAVQPGANDTRPLALNGLKILIVEDEGDARELLGFVLASRGARVTEAPDAPSALDILDDERFDVILSDIGMPQMDGITFIGHVRQRSEAMGGRTPAVALTAFTRAVDRMGALQAGFQAHVPKPVNVNELVTVLASVTGQLSRKR